LVDPDGRSKRIPEIGWTLLVIQRRTAKQSAFLNRLAQNLIAAVLISLILVSLAQLSLGREHRRLETRAQTDMLSGVMNRSVFEPLVAQLAAQMQGRQEPLAVALMDLDTG
jgi:GGDEF domain-containing protein